MADRSSPRSAIVLVCDRLNPAFLGPYGNTWIETAASNRVAAKSLLIEQCLTTSLGLSEVYERYWSSLADIEQTATLVTDEEKQVSHTLAAGFDTHIQLAADVGNTAATDIESTHWADLISAAMQQCDEFDREQGRLLWIHGRGCAGHWDAPYSLRESFAAEDDPAPPTFVRPPAQHLVGEVDPDELLGLQQAYAAEMTVFDHCLAPLVESLSHSAFENTLFVLTSPRGYPLGEHSVIGDARPVLQFESLHVPLVIRFPDGRFEAERGHSLWQPSDVGELVRRWLAGDEFAIGDFGTERVASQAEGHWSLRTPAWFATGLVNPDADDETRLFAKPDDRFEVNDVAGICKGIAQDMRSEFDCVIAATNAGVVANLPPLADALRVPQD